MMVPKLILAAVKDLLPSRDNPRIVSEDPEELNSDGLLDSVKAIGVQQPLQVRDHPTEPDRKEILAGERRWMCCRLAGSQTVMTLDYGAMPDDEAFRITCIENAHRKELKPLEQGRAASIALARCNGDVQAAASLLGQTPRWIAMGAKIHEGLTPIWQEGLLKNEYLRHWTAGHVALIARFPENVQRDLYDSIAKVRWQSEDVSVDGLAKKTSEILHVLAKAPFDVAGCEGCPKRSGRQHLLWTDDEADATGENERCLDAKCWREKETQAARREFSRQAKDHKGLVAVDLSKQHDYQRTQELERVYGDQLIESRLVGAKKYEVVKAETRGAIPALVVAGTGKGTVKYIKRIKAPSSSATPRKSKAEKQAAAGRERLLFAVRDALVRRVEATTVQQVMDNPQCLTGFLFAAVFSGGSGDPLWGKERTQFLDAWRTLTDEGDRMRFLYGKLWEMTKAALKESVFADYSLHPIQRESEEDMRWVAEAFGGDYGELVAATEAILAREDQIAGQTERVTVAVPKSLDASCELRLYEEAGKWFGGFLIEVPKARIDLPVDALGESYASKGSCCLTMAQAATEQVGKLKDEKKCPAALAKQIVGELDKIIKACELELRRSGQGSDEPATADDVPIVKPSGLIECPETIRVPMEKGWQAAITIKVAQVEGLWYVGWDAHVPRAGDCLPCSTAHQGYAGRNKALRAAVGRLEVWLAGKPGRKGYRHYDAVQGAAQAAVAAAMDVPSGL